MAMSVPTPTLMSALQSLPPYLAPTIAACIITTALLYKLIPRHSPPAPSEASSTSSTSSSGLPAPPGLLHLAFRTSFLLELPALLRALRQSPVMVLDHVMKHTPALHVGLPFGPHLVILRGLDLVRPVLAGEYELASAYWPPSTRQLFGSESMINVAGEAHRALRRHVAAAFSSKALRSYLQELQQLCCARCEAWTEQGQVLAYPAMKALTFEVIARVVCGFTMAPQELEACSALFSEWQQGIFSVPGGATYRRAMQVREELMAHIDRGLEALQRELQLLEQQEEGGGPEDGSAANQQPQQAPAGPDADVDEARQTPGPASSKAGSAAAGAPHWSVIRNMMALRDDAGQPQLSWPQLRAMCLLMFFAGHDSSSSTLALLMWRLSGSPHVMERLRKEQQALIQQHSPGITPEVVEAMAYGGACVKEALRMDPAVTGVFRRAERDFQLAGRYTVRAGWRLLCVLRATTRLDPRWEVHRVLGDPLHPDAFNPDRWLTPEGQASGAWLPFGAGPRLCPGYPLAMMEMKVLLAVLVRQYDWQLSAPEALRWRHFPMPAPMDGMPVSFSRRSDPLL